METRPRGGKKVRRRTEQEESRPSPSELATILHATLTKDWSQDLTVEAQRLHKGDVFSELDDDRPKPRKFVVQEDPTPCTTEANCIHLTVEREGYTGHSYQSWCIAREQSMVRQ